MTRYFGKVGYGSTQETIIESEDEEEPPIGSGVWTDVITEHEAYGDIVRINRKLEPGETLNDNLSVQNSISIVMDQYASDNFMNIRYIEWDGRRWKVTGVQLEPPRMIFTLGNLYNGPGPEDQS